MSKYSGQAEQVALSLYAMRNILVQYPLLSDQWKHLTTQQLKQEVDKAIAAFERMTGEAMFDVIISSSDGKKKYTETIDPKDKEWDDYFDDKTPEFTRPLSKFSHKDIGQYNEDGGHFIFGWMETFCQSDEVPMWMREADGLFIEVKMTGR